MKFIAKYCVCFEYMIDHLCAIELFHCDIKIRKLSSTSLYKLVDLNVDQCQSQFLFETHGALLGVAMILKRVIELKQNEKAKDKTIAVVPFSFAFQLSQHTLKALRNIISKLETTRGYRGRGGENVPEALCDVIAELSNVPNSIMILSKNKAIDRYEKSLNEHLCIPFDFVQNALNALKNVPKNYYCKDKQEENTNNSIFDNRKSMTLKRCNELQTSRNASVTRGLGVLPKSYL